MNASNDVSNSMAKLSGIQRAAAAALNENLTGYAKNPRLRDHFHPDLVGHYFSQFATHVRALQQLLPDLYGDFHLIEVKPDTEMASTPPRWEFSRSQLERLIRDIDQIFEVRANSQLAQPIPEPQRRVFITHGRSGDWRTVQAFVEKDIGLPTLELAQEPSGGRTVIEKLVENAARCDSAVVVRTGDDVANENEARVRENVMHELGFFHGRYGRDRVVLLHEDGVSIPSNLGGIVYVPYPKGSVDAGLHVLQRELRAIYRL